ncbi:MAG: CpaF family protein [Elusimicrobiota bacterium]
MLAQSDVLSGILGPLRGFLNDSMVQEIMVIKFNHIFIEKMGQVIKATESFDSENHLKSVIDQIVSHGNRRVDIAAPFCDTRLPDGSRVHIVLPPVAIDGPILTIRKFTQNFHSLNDLVYVKSISPEHTVLLENVIHNRSNILICGNTGSGKTTLMNVISQLVNEDERILTLEDTAELNIQKPHVVRMETRLKNTEGQGEISMKDLVINCLRMRPDRILMGECRGEEVLPLIQAMNTGHKGSMTTLHANSAQEALYRLEVLLSMASPKWPISVVRQQIISAFDVVIYMERVGGIRKLKEIADVDKETLNFKVISRLN